MPSASAPAEVNTAAEPVVDDLSITLLAGRVPAAETRKVISYAREAERLGFKRVWVPERYSVKEAGTVLGAVAASTERIGVGTGPMTLASRPPAVTASMAMTIQSMFGDRFCLGIGRGPQGSFITGHGFSQVDYPTLIDWAGIIKRLWAGETIDYRGPAGTYEGLSMEDRAPDDIPAPEILFFHMGGPRASRIAANPVFDGVALANLTTPDAHRRSIEQTLEECERIGRDPSTLRFISPVTTAPGVDEERLRALIGVRIFIYLQLPQLGEMLRRVNGWDLATADRIRNENPYAHLKERVDSAVQRDELVKMTKLVPEEWMREAAAAGTVDECVTQLQRYRDAGSDEIDIYAGDPFENAELIQAWRRHKAKTGVFA